MAQAGNKLTKESVDYGAGKEVSHCGNCVHFRPGPDPFGNATCALVAGPVRWHMWCKKWKARA
jgi:hypothetical protein